MELKNETKMKQGQELNNKIALLVGWKYEPKGHLSRHWVTPTGGIVRSPWNYSGKADLALEACEIFCKEHDRRNQHPSIRLILNRYGTWICELEISYPGSNVFSNGRGIDAPEAICNAVLALAEQIKIYETEKKNDNGKNEQ